MRLKLIFLFPLLIFFNDGHLHAKTSEDVITQTIQNRLQQDQIPSITVIAGNSEKALYRAAFSKAGTSYIPTQLNTLYDIASITKIFTAMAIQKLVEESKLKLEDKLTQYLDSQSTDLQKRKITIEDLLRHQSGFAPVLPPSVYSENLDETWQNIIAFNPNRRYGDFTYSDVNYILLGLIIEKVSKQSLESFLNDHFIVPLSLKNTGFNAHRGLLQSPIIAPTQRDPGRLGHVHDPSSFALAGMTGHAGKALPREFPLVILALPEHPFGLIPKKISI